MRASVNRMSSGGLPFRKRMLGQSMMEYFVVTAFTVIILIEGADSSVIQNLVTAMKEAYEGFSFATGFASNLNGF